LSIISDKGNGNDKGTLRTSRPFRSIIETPYYKDRCTYQATVELQLILKLKCVVTPTYQCAYGRF